MSEQDRAELLVQIVEQLYPQMAHGPREQITLVRIEGGGAYPSQWWAYDAEGRFYYLRYRHSYGSVQRSPSEELHCSAWNAETKQWENTEVVATFEWGPYEDCGHITLEKFCELAGIVLDLQESV